jgi:crotonobetainyl-CoA:carnitine CoA-transferase CaiB-like acyl-CoA transferase
MAAPLEGLRVLDFSHALAGPYCTMIMAHYGAQIYKVESLEGELGRTWGPPYTNGEASYFLGINTGKRSLSIDMKSPAGIALCLDLVEKADILIENMRPGTLERLGLGYAVARARNPRLIYCSISGYGQTGPSRDDAAMDLILQAASGLISVTGVEGGERVRCGHSVADITSGMFALIGILMAVQSRSRTGEGQFVDVSMLDSMISAMASNFANFSGSQIVPGSMGTRFATIVPYRGFPTADRDIVIAVASNKLWVDFCGAIDRADLSRHPDYIDNAARVKNREVLEKLITDIFRTQPSSYWVERFRECGIPCSAVRTLDEVTADAQANERGMFPSFDGFQVTGPPVKFSATPGAIPRRSPHLGEHTREILQELLGYDATALDGLESSGIIRQAKTPAAR